MPPLTIGRLPALALLAALLPWPGAGGYTIYVTNEISGDLTIIDGATHQVADTVQLGKRPRGIQVSPDGEFLYVALSGSPIAPPGVDETTLPPADKSADGIGVFSVAERRLLRVIRGVSDPEQLAVGASGQYLYIASEDTGTAVIVTAEEGDVVAALPVGGEPEGVAIAPDGSIVYVTSEADHVVSVIDTATHALAGAFDVGMRPRAAAFTPDGERAYVTGEIDGTVSVVDTDRLEVIHTVTLPGPGALPMGVAVAPDGATVYVATGRGRQLVAIDGETHEVVASVEVGQRPWGVALSPDGRYAYTANGPSDDVAVVDTSSMRVIDRIEVGTRPWGVLVVGDAKRASN